jgi:hypothetical protein
MCREREKIGVFCHETNRRGFTHLRNWTKAALRRLLSCHPIQCGCHGRLSSTPEGDLNEAPRLGYRDGAGDAAAADSDAIWAVARSPGSRGPRSPARGGVAAWDC